MPAIFIEQVPIEAFYLGWFGFDHLQLVYVPDSLTSEPVPQDEWFVLEGTRSETPTGVLLGALGDDGRLRLYIAAGGLRGEALEAAIGTPEQRGSRLVTDVDAEAVWQAMVSHAQDIADTQYHYVGFGFRSSTISTLNSTSFVTSVLYAGGFDIDQYFPYNLGFSPGYNTLLGGYLDETLFIDDLFNALYGGYGFDSFRGLDHDAVDRLYGGHDNDLFYWSGGIDYVFGGHPGVPYSEDGTDAISFAGAGEVFLEHLEHNVPHHSPQFIATFEAGITWMFSVEYVRWNADSEYFTLGPNVELIESNEIIHFGNENDGRGDQLSLDGASTGLTVNFASSTAHFVSAESNESGAGFWVESVEWLIGSAHDDRIWGGETLRGVEGGAGNDFIDARHVTPFSGESPRGFDVEIDGGAGDDTIVSGRGRTVATGGDGADRFILSTVSTPGQGSVEFVIENADASDRLFLPYNLVNGSGLGLDGSQLMPILGAIGTYEEMRDYGFEQMFHHRTLDMIHHSNDEPNGVIHLLGYIGFYLDGDDLVIIVLSGEAFTETVPIDDAGNTETRTYIGSDSDTTAYIRIVDFEIGDLGLMFIDPGPSTTGSDGSPYYPYWDSAVSQLNQPFLSPLDTRPASPDDPTDPENAPPPRDDVQGTGGDDLISVDQPSNIDAGDGDDTITADGGWNDTIDGGAGADHMEGGAGSDTYVVDNAGDMVVEHSGGGIDQVYTSISYTLADNVEDLYLTGAAATGTGNAGRNRLVGNDGDNTLTGLAGGDTFLGGGGSDVLDGGDGSDGYIYTRGDGRDLVIDSGTDGDDRDVLYLFGEIAPDDVTAYVIASAPGDLVLAIAGGGSITIVGFMTGEGRGIDLIRFENGVAWDRDAIEDLAASARVLASAAPDAVDDPMFYYGGSEYVVPAPMLLGNDADPDGDPITLVGVSGLSVGSAYIDANGDIQLVLPPGYGGVVSFTYTIADSNGGTATANASVTIVPNSAPVATMAVPDQSATAGEAWTLALPATLFTDADGNAIAITARLADGSALPSWLRFDWRTDTFSGTPPAGESGLLSIVLTASDGMVPTTLTFTLSVTASEPGMTIAGSTLDEALTGGAGDDVFLLHASSNGIDTYDGGAGHDTISGNPWNDVIGIASLTSVEVINAGDGNDTVRLTDADDAIDLSGVTLLGVELVDAGAGNDTINGSAGNDTIRGNTGDDWLSGGAGDDTFTILGSTDGSDHFDGGDGTDTILGSAWNDVIGIASLTGIEIIDAGAGSDTLRLTAGNDTLDLSGTTLTGVELIDAGAGNDTITGSAGNDTIRGNAGDDSLSGGAGNDTFTILGSTDGTDHFDGGSGTDTILGSAWNDVISVASLTGVEIVDAGAGNDTLRLTAGNDTLDLSGTILIGLELIDAGAGNDIVTGSAGNDTIRGNAGNDTLSGGAGNDTFTVVGSTDGTDHIDGGSGIDTLLGSGWNDVISVASLAGIEIIDAGAGNDTLRLTAGNDVLDLSDVTLFGVELIDAGGGNDTITGSAGNDVLTGGSGLDLFVFHAGFGHDTITDFAAGAGGDTIDLSFAGFTSFSELMAGATMVGTDTVISVGAGQSITLRGVAIGAIQADDFMIA